MLSEIVWDQDPELEYGQGERAAVGPMTLGTWRTDLGVWHWDLWDTELDKELRSGVVEASFPGPHEVEARRRATAACGSIAGAN